MFALITHCVCLDNANVLLTKLNSNFVPHLKKIIKSTTETERQSRCSRKSSVEKKKTWHLKLIDKKFFSLHESTSVKMHMIDFFIVPLRPEFHRQLLFKDSRLLDKTYASVVHGTSGLIGDI